MLSLQARVQSTEFTELPNTDFWFDQVYGYHTKLAHFCGSDPELHRPQVASHHVKRDYLYSGGSRWG